MSIRLRPLGCRIIVECDEEVFEEGVSRGEDGKLYQAGGLIQIPDSVAENYERQAMTGEVIAVGDALEWPIKVGSRVLFGRHSGDWVPSRISDVYGSEKCRMMAEDDIVCLIEETCGDDE